MKEDIDIPKVENVAVAVVKEVLVTGEEDWNVYLINLKNEPISNVLITSKGYGSKGGVKKETSVLRHFIDELKPNHAAKIEPIQTDVFELTNEYWVSFYIGKKIYDKRYIYVAETISEKNFTTIPVIQKPGVLIN